MSCMTVEANDFAFHQTILQKNLLGLSTQTLEIDKLALQFICLGFPVDWVRLFLLAGRQEVLTCSRLAPEELP